jgi:hypothetical protein
MNRMDREAPVRALIGFVMGALMGAVLSLGGAWLLNLLMVWRGLEPRVIHWWDALPLAVILGLSLAINMYRPPFGD